MSGTEVLYAAAAGVAQLTINRPERRNALSWPVVSEIRARLAEAKADPSVQVVVLDRRRRQGVLRRRRSRHDGRRRVVDAARRPGRAGRPVRGSVEPRKADHRPGPGFALAGGFGLALSCDFVICSDDAVFGTPEIDVGLWPYMITVPLVRSMPPKRALELMSTGPPGARRGGRADRLRQPGRARPRTSTPPCRELATGLAAKSPGDRETRAGTRSTGSGTWRRGEALAYLHAMLTVTVATDDAQEGLAAFAEKRPPRWSGR